MKFKFLLTGTIALGMFMFGVDRAKAVPPPPPFGNNFQLVHTESFPNPSLARDYSNKMKREGLFTDQYPAYTGSTPMFIYIVDVYVKK